MKFICFYLFIGLMSCKEKSHLKNKVKDDSSYKSSLIGIWGDLETPGWNITPDSIYYFERDISYPYKIINHDLVIDLYESKGILRNVRVIKDTFFWLDEQGFTVKAFRMN